VRQNPPVIFGRLVSRDEMGALITAGFVTDRLSNREVYSAVFDHVQKIKEDFEDPACREGEGNSNAVVKQLSRMGGAIRRVALGASSERHWREGCEMMVFVSGQPIQVGWTTSGAGTGSSSPPSRR
jgi:hypothetical protein